MSTPIQHSLWRLCRARYHKAAQLLTSILGCHKPRWNSETSNRSDKQVSHMLTNISRSERLELTFYMGNKELGALSRDRSRVEVLQRRWEKVQHEAIEKHGGPTIPTSGSLSWQYCQACHSRQHPASNRFSRSPQSVLYLIFLLCISAALTHAWKSAKM